MSETESKEKCTACGGRLVDYDDYVSRRALRGGLASMPVAVIICAIWAPVFCLARLIIGGATGQMGGGEIVALLAHKVLVGIVIGVLISVAVAIGRADLGLFIGAVIGSIGGFFVAAADAMPLLSDAAHRIDIVLVSVISGLLCVATVYVSEMVARKKSGRWIGPEPVEADSDSSGE
ncbi:MAG TPA: hypothetical protein PLN69_07780 [bacterium]|nr:hypothetical protein [bacterium]